MDEFWVFGYGSLMWNPGFPFEEKSRARASGFHRALCLRSFVHRGTPQRPGLVLGLDRGGSCLGIAFRISAAEWAGVVDYLRERELVTEAYRERVLSVSLAGGRAVRALAYIVDRDHAQYAGGLSAAEAAVIVANASGRSGLNTDYVKNTLAHLGDMGIRDRWLEEVGVLIGESPQA